MILTGFVLGVLIANATVASGADWRTVAPVNGLDLEPGDRVLFEGGAVR